MRVISSCSQRVVISLRLEFLIEYDVRPLSERKKAAIIKVLD